MAEDKYRDLRLLICEAAEDSISKERMAELNRILIEDADARRYYQECVLNSVILNTMYGNEKSYYDPNSINAEDTSINYIQKLAEMELVAPEVEINKEEKIVERISVKENKPVKQSKFFRIFDKLVYIAASLLIMFIVYAEIFAPNYSVSVATVIDQIGVTWDRSSEKLSNNDRILTNQAPYVIKKGIVKIGFDQGVKVLIEGPAEFVVERNGLFLGEGRIYSLVSSSGKGFTIDTSSARYVDLGTEFGIDVSKSGISELHVMTGRVQLFAGVEKEEKISQLITENEAIQYVADTGKLKLIPVRSEEFIRDIDSSKDMVWHGQMEIDLADIVGGGNGFGTGVINHGILIDDATVSTYPLYVKDYNIHPIAKGRLFKPVPQLPAVDGIFIPDGGNKRTVVSSQGHTFSECPDTTSSYCVPIINGGQYDKDSDEKFIINNESYGTKNNPSIFMHANIGITYDMNELRRHLPDGVSLSKFVSLASSPDNPENISRNLDIWVLVDGELRFSKTNISSPDAFDIDIPLNTDERYLSLVVTQGRLPNDGSMGDSWDWMLFGVPRIILKSEYYKYSVNDTF